MAIEVSLGLGEERSLYKARTCKSNKGASLDRDSEGNTIEGSERASCQQHLTCRISERVERSTNVPPHQVFMVVFTNMNLEAWRSLCFTLGWSVSTVVTCKISVETL